MKVRLIKPNSADLLDYVPDKYKYYPVRTGNSLAKIKSWANWVRKNHPETKILIIYDRMNLFKKKEYWMGRYKGGNEDRYIVYTDY